ALSYLVLEVTLFEFGTVLFLFVQNLTPTETYPLCLHDALPILAAPLMNCTTPTLMPWPNPRATMPKAELLLLLPLPLPLCTSSRDRKSTRLNSSHVKNSYAVFCLKKKNKQ